MSEISTTAGYTSPDKQLEALEQEQEAIRDYKGILETALELADKKIDLLKAHATITFHVLDDVMDRLDMLDDFPELKGEIQDILDSEETIKLL